MQSPTQITFPKRLAILAFGVATYAFFLFTFVWVMFFIEGVLLESTMDAGHEAPLGEAILVNCGILGLFGVQHTIMARLWFKRWWTRIVAPAIERSIFVLVTCAILVLLMTQWRVVPDVVWSVEDPVWSTALTAVAFGGWGLVLLATFLIDHFSLFGLRQAIDGFRGRETAEPAFQVHSLYRYTRHPLYLGFLIAFWSTPHMTVGGLVFAITTTAYLAVGMRIEERTLVGVHGAEYTEYQRLVPMLLPRRGAAPHRGSGETTVVRPVTQ